MLLIPLLVLICLIGREAYLQVVKYRMVVVLNKETPDVGDMPDPYNGTRTNEEFNLGLALVTLLDMDRNPDEYVDADFNKIDELIEGAEAYWRMKYNKRILELE